MLKKINFLLNDNPIESDLNPATVLLDYLRSLKLNGTKEGCKEGDCGACTVICGQFINGRITYRTINSCLIPVMNIIGTHIVTIEGLNNFSGKLTPIQNEFIKEGASQCGFCTPGFIVSLTSYFLSHSDVKNNNILDSIDGNICRCTGHNSIIRAAENILKEFKILPADFNDRLIYLVEKNIIPKFFLSSSEALLNLQSKLITNDNNITNSNYFIAGGTDLFVQKPDEMLSDNISFILDQKIDNKIFEKDDYFFIHSSSTVTDILESTQIRSYFPIITEFSELFGSTPIRNSATIGGNINNASPIGDMTAFFMALDANVVLSDGVSEREVPLKNYYTGYKKTVRRSGEYLKFVNFRIPEGEYYFNFEKVSKRTYLDIASVNTAVFLKLDKGLISNINISAGGVFKTPKFLSNTSEFLMGKKIDSSVIREAVKIADSEISPISDTRGTDIYKRLLLSRLIFTHFIKLFPELIDIKETV